MSNYLSAPDDLKDEFLEYFVIFQSFLLLLFDPGNFCLVKQRLPFSACNSLQRNTTGDQGMD